MTVSSATDSHDGSDGKKRGLRIACVQFDVQLREPRKNLNKIRELTNGLKPGTLDLLVLPEMCRSGYIFTSARAMLPYLEDQADGPTGQLAIQLAKRLRCHVIAGYPEKYVPPGAPRTPTQVTVPVDGSGIGYTSALVVGPRGDVIGNYRKSSLFEMDKCWAREGNGFMYFDLPYPLGRTGLVMCMDLNPRGWEAPWNAYEVGTFAQHNRLDTLVAPMNWLATHTPQAGDRDHDLKLPDEGSLKYWAARLAPIHDPQLSDPVGGKALALITCNNVGVQEGVLFVGTSCVMKLSPRVPHIEVVDVLSMSEEAVMITTVD